MLNRNFFYQFINMLFSYVLSLLSAMYVSRTLHPSVLGQVRFTGAAIGYFVLLANLGIPIYAFRKTAEYREDKGKLSAFVKEMLLLGTAFDALAMALCVAFTFCIDRFNTDKYLFWILMWQILLGTFSFEWLYKGTEQFKKLAVRTIFVRLVSLGLILLLVRREEDVLIYAGITVFTSLLTALINWQGIKGEIDWSVKVRFTGAFAHYKGIFIFFLMSCAVSIYADMDVFMLGFLAKNDSVGYYSVASSIKTILTAVGGVLWGIALPKATLYWKNKDVRRFHLLGRKNISFILWLQIPVTAFSLVAAEYMITFIGGEEYLPGVTAFRILIASLIPIAVSNIIGGQLLIPSGKEKKLLAAEILGAVTNLILNFFFIVKWGINGAAISTLIAEIVVTAYVMLVVKRELKAELFDIVPIVKQTLTATITGAAVFLLLRNSVFGDNPFVVLCASAIVFFLLDVGLLRICREKITCDEIWPMVKTYVCILLGRINRKRLVVGKEVPEKDNASELKYCPCCGNYVKAMVYNRYHWFPKTYAPGVYLPEKRKTECPNCGAFPRHRLLMWYFKEHTQELKDSHAILYYACEDVVKGWLTDNGITYTTADLFAPADLRIDIEDTGLEENTYDYIICNHVLEHVNDYKRALRETYRILAPNGIFICSFPLLDSLETCIEAASSDLTEAEKIKQFGQRDHLRIFGSDSRSMLESIGFAVEEYDKASCPEYIVPEDGPGRYDKTLLFICRKPAEQMAMKTKNSMP